MKKDNKVVFKTSDSRLLLDANAQMEVSTLAGHKAIEDSLEFWCTHYNSLVKSGASPETAYDACFDGYRYQVSTLSCRYLFLVLDGLPLPGTKKLVSKKSAALDAIGYVMGTDEEWTQRMAESIFGAAIHKAQLG